MDCDGDFDCCCCCQCLGECCCQCCVECGCQLCEATDCCGLCGTNCSRSTKRCCCYVVTALFAVAIATLVAVLVVAYAVVFPARVTVEEAHLGRLALDAAGANNGTGTALAYDVSLAIAVRNRDFATGVWRTAPLDAELRFRGQTFARASARLESAEWGLFRARGKGLYRVTAAADSGVALGGDGLAEFVRESVGGVFELELAVVGGRDSSVVSVTCPLKLSLPTATAPVAFTGVKCT